MNKESKKAMPTAQHSEQAGAPTTDGWVRISAPRIGSDAKIIDRQIYYLKGPRPELRIEENGRPICGIIGPLAKSRLRILLS